MTRVFCDFHHSSLYESLLMLLEDRFGWEVYRPIGKSWFDKGYWLIAKPYNDNPATIEQFLGIRDDFTPSDGTPPLNGVINKEDEVYHLYDVAYGRTHKAVTFEQFQNMQFDILLSTYAPHYKTFHDLLRFQPQAKHVCQAGNNWLDVVDWSVAKNMMASCAVQPGQIPAGVNWVSYHQSFSLDTFRYTLPDYNKKQTISSFVNALSQWPQVLEEISEYEKWLGLTFLLHGASNRDGAVHRQEDISTIMRDSLWGWHIKPGGDGYGHIIHNWAAIGRPLIVHRSQYRGQLADALLEDGHTCVDLDIGDLKYNSERILFMSDPDIHSRLCNNMYKRFAEVVNFEKEASNLEDFFSRLL